MANADSFSLRDEQLAAVLASPPPRTLTPELRRAALRQSAPLSFAIFGLLFGGFGLLFVWIFFPWNFTRDLRLHAPGTIRTEGRIVSMANTSLSINKTRVVRFEFEFRTPDGGLVRGTCYTTGRRWITGDPVPVRYRPEDPSIASPVEGRLSLSSPVMAFVLVFPLVGGGLVLWVVIARRRALSLLKHGLAIEAFVTDVEHTQTAINDYPVYKTTLQRLDLPGNPPIQLRHWQPKIVAFLHLRLKNKQPIYLVCDPSKPSRCLLPEAL